jgi:iron complex outermembrane receptor protein
VATHQGYVTRLACALGGALVASLRAMAGDETLAHAPTVELIVTAPADPSGVPRDRVASNTVFIAGEAFEDRPGAGIAEVIASRSGSAFVTFPQGSPYQPQFTFRGYGVSSLLGMPQGLSVYLDGVRVNSPFGDGIDWALLPRTALDNATIVPGSNPLFGANTLGGALVLRTKSGDANPGVEAHAYTGSSGRRGARFEAGRAFEGGTHAYIGGSAGHEDGWRDHSPSDVKEVFAKLGRRGPAGEVELSLAAANADTNGNGLAPRVLTDQRREAVYTWPDETHETSRSAQARWTSFLPHDSRVSALAYVRRGKARSSGGDLDDADHGTVPGVPPAVVNGSSVNQRSRGASIALETGTPALRWSIGGNFDHAKSDFARTQAPGRIGEDRGIIAIGGDEVEAALSSTTRNAGLYAMATWAPAPAWSLTLSGRGDRTTLAMTDTGPTAPDLDGDHRYRSFNPMLGAIFKPREDLSVFGNVGRATRAPSAIELGCADPAKPCRLPNALLSDPHLNQVVSTGWEAGARGAFGTARWSAAVFGATNKDDILFVGASAASGYFTNFGRTRRRGFEITVSSERGDAEWLVSYGYLDATYRASACLPSLSDSTCGLSIRPGDRMSELPRQTVKASSTWRPAGGARVGLDFLAASDRLVRGNENGAQSRGGTAPGYAVLNLRGDLRLGRKWLAYVNVDNVFDTRYVTTGVLARSALDASGRVIADPSRWSPDTFFSPGAPRTFLVGLRYELRE